MVDVWSGLVVFPLVHDLISMLGIVSSDLSVDKLLLRDVIVGGLVCSQF